MIDNIFPLRESELFGGLSRTDLSTIANICEDSHVGEGGLLFRQGHSAAWLYIITEGMIALQTAIRVPHATQSRSTTVALCGRGEIIGWSAMVEPFRYEVSASAWGNCRLIAIDARLLRKSLETNPLIGFEVMQSLFVVMSRRTRQVTEALVNERRITAARMQTITDW